MKTKLTYYTLLIAAICATPHALAQNDAEEAALKNLPMTMPNFRLQDTSGNLHELSDYADSRYIVLFVQMNGCPIVRQSFPYFDLLRKDFEDTGVKFLMVNCSDFDDSETVAAETKDYAVKVPVLMDHNQVLANALAVTRSAETFVVDPKTSKIIYRGKADDRFDYGLQRSNPTHFWVRDILGGKKTETTRSVTKGCLLDLVELPDTIDFESKVAPLLKSHNIAQADRTAIWTALLEQRDANGNTIDLSKTEALTIVAWLRNTGA